MNHETIFRKFDVMDIPKGSIVLLCGVQNCGKSTWSKKHFKEECIINTDDVFYSILEKYSPAEKTFEEIEMLTSLEIKRLIDESKTKNEYTVVDAVPTEYEERISWIEDFCTEFKNVILIAFKSNILEVLSNPRKPASHLEEKWDITFPPQEYIVMANHGLLQEIKSDIIRIGAIKTYILSTENKNSIKCEIN